jgi:hypothetical protein
MLILLVNLPWHTGIGDAVLLEKEQGRCHRQRNLRSRVQSSRFKVQSPKCATIAAQIAEFQTLDFEGVC